MYTWLPYSSFCFSVLSNKVYALAKRVFDLDKVCEIASWYFLKGMGISMEQTVFMGMGMVKSSLYIAYSMFYMIAS